LEHVSQSNLNDIFSQTFSYSGRDKLKCYLLLKKTYGSMENIVNHLNARLASNSNNLHSAAYEEVQTNTDNTHMTNQYVENEYETQTTSTTQAVKAQSSSEGHDIWYYPKLIGVSILAIFLIVVFWKVIRYIISFIYDVFNKHRMVYMKVILPRLDTKMDREREKDIAKDMKEKI